MSDIISYDDQGNILLPNIKRIFLPDEGKEIMDADLSGADAMVVAADSQCKWLLDFFNNPKGKLYAYIASEHLQREITADSPEYKSYKAVCHGCITGDHEVLTPNGWIRIDKYDENIPLAVWDKDNSQIHFEIPKSFNRDFIENSEFLYSIEGESFSQLTTLDHKFIRQSNGKLIITQAKDLPISSRLPYTGEYKGGSKKELNVKMKLMVALQADGHVLYTDKKGISTYQFRFTKERKINRLENLLVEAGIQFQKKFSESDKVTTFYFKGYLEAWMKYLDWWILDYEKDNLKTFVEELQYWDGHIRTSNGVRTSITTTNKLSAEIIQTLFHLFNYGSKINIKLKDKTRQTLYEISMNNRKFYRCSTGIQKYIEHIGTKVYCPQTSTGFFMIRRNGHIMVTGNTNYGLGLDKLAAMLGISWTYAKSLQDFYFNLCPEILKWHVRIKKDIDKKGYITNVFGRRGWFLDSKDPTLFNKAFAFIPQSTVADVINRGWVNITSHHGDIVEVLMQVHDSLVMQYDISYANVIRNEIKKQMSIVLPYKPPMVIPADFKVSRRSYGECEKVRKLQ